MSGWSRKWWPMIALGSCCALGCAQEAASQHTPEAAVAPKAEEVKPEPKPAPKPETVRHTPYAELAPVRVPLLDHRLVEAAVVAPSAMKVPNGINKPLLVNAVDDPLVSRAGAAPKRGFSLPMRQWMQQSADELEDLAAGADVLDRRAVRGLWSQFRGNRLHWSRAWALSVMSTVQHTPAPAVSAH